MAKVKYGAIVTELKGKIAGQVFQGGNVGYVLRNKGYTPGSSTALRQAANQNLVANTTGWRTLTDTQRATWNSGAANWPFKDKFGNAYTGSGFQVYNAFNATRKSLGLSIVTSMPAVESPANPGAITAVVDTDGDLNLTWVTNGNTPDYIAAWGTSLISAGRNSNNGKFRRLGSVSINGIANTSAIAYGVDGVPFPPPPINAWVLIKVAFYNSLFPYAYYITTIRVQVTAP